VSETDFQKRMREAVEEMDKGGLKDPTADMQVFPANREITTSPKIVNHDRIWEMLRNAHPGLESGDIEALLEYVHDKPLSQLITEGYPPPDKAKLREVLDMDYVEAAKLAFSDDPLLDWVAKPKEDEEEEQDG
jgi:hypothetical protein